MYPKLHSHELLGSDISTYTIALVSGVLLSQALGCYFGRRFGGVRPQTTLSILLLLGIVAFAGARAHYLLNSTSPSKVVANPLAVGRIFSGLHAGGAFVALALGTPLLVGLFRIKLGRFLDATVPAMGVGIAIARLGCFLNGCCFGTPSNLPWALSFPQASPPHRYQVAAGIVAADAFRSAPVHPLQLYFALAGLGAAAASLYMNGRQRFVGESALVGATVFFLVTAIAESVRAPYYAPNYYWAGELQFSWIAWALACASIAALAIAELLSARASIRKLSALGSHRL